MGCVIHTHGRFGCFAGFTVKRSESKKRKWQDFDDGSRKPAPDEEEVGKDGVHDLSALPKNDTESEDRKRKRGMAGKELEACDWRVKTVGRGM